MSGVSVMRLGGVCLLAAMVVFAPVSNAEAGVVRKVDSERIRLGDLLPKAPARIADLDVAAAPSPGATRVFTRNQILARLKLAMVSPKGLRIPKQVKVIRPAQVVSEVTIQRMVKRLEAAPEVEEPDE